MKIAIFRKQAIWGAAGTVLLLAGCGDNVPHSPSPIGTSTVQGLATVNNMPAPNRTVFLDLNTNGQLDPGEPSVTTDASGQYTLTTTATGSARPGIVLQAGETLQSTDGRIVGGTNAPAGAYPWMVQIQAGNGLCGGTLIRPNWVLTAAHCFVTGNVSVPAADVTVFVGSIRLNEGTSIGVRRVINHPNYRVGPRDELINDVTLLELATPVTNRATIPFATNDAQFATATTARAIGWGTTEEDGDIATTLQQIDLPLLSNSQCQTLLSGVFTIENVMICAGGEAGRDTCQGDSGGPLFVTTPNGPLQIGITSFGEGCARPNRAGVYARTSAPLLANFINDTIGTPSAPTVGFAPEVTLVPGQSRTVNFRITSP